MRIALIILFAGFVISAPAHAVGQLADIQVYDRSDGRILNTYIHNGRYYVAGEPGHEYQINVTSTSDRRVLAVSSVDGVNVITGDTASTNQSGYVLSAYGNMEIAGWRKSMERINTFFFTTLKNSYAARTGRPNEVGVIGVALFREQQHEPAPQHCCWPFRSSRDEADSPAAKSESAGRLNDAMPAPATEAAQALQRQEKKLGTGYGRGEDSTTRYTEFERASDTPDEVVKIYYDSTRNLIAQGVIPKHYAERQANPFPNGFVPPP
jgi:hypothetical protein